MSYLKKFGLALSAIAICLSLYAASVNAQPGRARWDGNNGRHRGWEQGQRNGWNRGRKTGWQTRSSYWRQQNRYGYGRITPREYLRLQRQRSRIYRNTNRYYRDGYLNYGERRRLERQTNRYRRNVYRDRRDW